MYSIGKAELMIGLNASTLRYYEKEGLLPDVHRDDSGRRVYSDQQIEWIKFVKAMKETGMTIDQIKEYINLIYQGEEKIQEMRDFLENHKKRVEEQMSKTQKNLERIIQKIAFYDIIVMGKKQF